MTTTATERKTPLHDLQAIRRQFRLLVGDGNVTELRALEATTKDDRYPRTLFGYFNNADDLAKWAGTIKTAKGIYIIPNQINPALLARRANRIKQAGKGDATQDSDIIRRRWLLVDCDAIGRRTYRQPTRNTKRPGNVPGTYARSDTRAGMARSDRGGLGQRVPLAVSDRPAGRRRRHSATLPAGPRAAVHGCGGQG